jgi:hypothetical protein
MAVFLAGLGSIIAQEIGKVAIENSPLIKQVATSAVVNVAKQSFNNLLDMNPNFSHFLGHFGITRYGEKKTFTNRGRHRRMAMQH